MIPRAGVRLIAAAVAAAAVGGGAYGIVGATSGSGSGTANAATVTAVPRAGGGGSNARSGPGAGGSIGTVNSLSGSGFTLVTPAGQKVTVRSGAAVKKGETVLVLGTVSNTTITATQVIKEANVAAKASPKVVPFARGTASPGKSVGQIPASYQPGSGTIVSGNRASKATKAALAAYPGGIVDRVVLLINGEYEVHYIGVNWPHHVFVNASFKVLGAG